MSWKRMVRQDGGRASKVRRAWEAGYHMEAVSWPPQAPEEVLAIEIDEYDEAF